MTVLNGLDILIQNTDMNTFLEWLEYVKSNPEEWGFYFLLFLSLACFVQLGLQIADPKRYANTWPFQRFWFLFAGEPLAKYPTFVWIVNLLLSLFLGLAFLVLALSYKGFL